MQRRLVALALLGALLAPPAMAQDRPPAERQILVDLAYALGESHALRQVCAGDGDQYWRDRMVRLGDTEAAEEAFSARLTQAFNSGFATRQTEFPSCGPASRRAEQAVARKGQGLAGRLSAIQRVVRTTGPADLNDLDPDSAGRDSVAEPRRAR